MRIKKESLIEYIDLIELGYPPADNTRLKQTGPLVKRNESSYKFSNFKCDRAGDIEIGKISLRTICRKLCTV